MCSTAWGQRSSPIWVTGTVGVVPGQPIGAEVHAGVALDADEVVAAGGPQEDVLQHLLGRIPQRLTALVGRDLRHRQRQPDRESPGPDRSASTARRWARTMASFTAA